MQLPSEFKKYLGDTSSAAELKMRERLDDEQTRNKEHATMRVTQKADTAAYYLQLATLKRRFLAAMQQQQPTPQTPSPPETAEAAIARQWRSAELAQAMQNGTLTAAELDEALRAGPPTDRAVTRSDLHPAAAPAMPQRAVPPPVSSDTLPADSDEEVIEDAAEEPDEAHKFGYKDADTDEEPEDDGIPDPDGNYFAD